MLRMLSCVCFPSGISELFSDNVLHLAFAPLSSAAILALISVYVLKAVVNAASFPAAVNNASGFATVDNATNFSGSGISISDKVPKNSVALFR